MVVFISWLLLWMPPATPAPHHATHAIAFRADSIPYNLNTPTAIVNLSNDDLTEISGLSLSGIAGIFCAISDEKGEVLFIDGLGGGVIKRRVLFRDKGDFEGIEKVHKRLYAVKSDGDIYEVCRWKHGKIKYKKYETGLSKSDDVEGLGYDKQRHALLVACKGNPDSANIRPVFAFDLRSKQLIAKPVYSIDPIEVNARMPYDEQDKKHFFSSSGIAIHPLTGAVYVISTALKRLIILDYNTGVILHVARLDKKMLPQPEGITFDLEGNLYLSSEGKKGEDAMLLRFDYLKPN